MSLENINFRPNIVYQADKDSRGGVSGSGKTDFQEENIVVKSGDRFGPAEVVIKRGKNGEPGTVIEVNRTSR